MPCTPKKTLKSAIESGNDVVIQVKGNQAQLLTDCELVALMEVPIDSFIAPPEKGHGRIESRECFVFNCEFTTDPEWENLISQIVVVKRQTEKLNTLTKNWKYYEETAFYISTTIRSAEQYNSIIRGHWSIENRNHRVKDGTFAEDEARIRLNPSVMAIIRSFSLNTMRANNLKNIKQSRYTLAININKLLNLNGVKT